ncbi:MAG: BACON domain-containing protein [Prevotella sp.]|nr:BACON domain-containing protein [Prevotella sp.]
MKHLLSYFSITFLTLSALLTISCGSEDTIPDGIIPSNEYFKVVGDTITIDGKATEASFPIAADCAWSIVTNGWDDLHATPDHGEGNQTVKIVTSANNTPLMRKGTLAITTSDGIKKVITILHLAGNIQLNVSQTEVNFGINGGSTEVTVTSNTNWTVAGGTDWCKVDKTSGTGNGAFTITANKSDEKEARKATFSVTPQGSTTPVIITVVQSNKDIDLAVSPARLTFNATTPQIKELDIISNDRWTATVSDDWLKIDQKEGNNTTTIHVSCESNDTGVERTATITVRSNGLTEMATVIQRNFNAEFSILTTLQEYPAAGGVQTVAVSSNIEWEVSCDTDWCHLSKTDNSVVVTVDANLLTTPRTADIIFMPTDLEPLTLTVVQREVGATVVLLDVSPTELTFGPAMESKTLTVDCNEAMSCQADQDWVTLQTIGQTTEGEFTHTTVQVTCSDNLTGAERQAKVTVSAGDKVQTVSIIQTMAGLPVVYNLLLTDNYDAKATLTAAYQSSLPVVEYGFVYATHSAPTLNDTKVTFNGSNTTGNMSTTLTGLTIGTTYYVRAYAISAMGTAYSDELYFNAQGREPSQDDNGTPMPSRNK